MCTLLLRATAPLLPSCSRVGHWMPESLPALPQHLPDNTATGHSCLTHTPTHTHMHTHFHPPDLPGVPAHSPSSRAPGTLLITPPHRGFPSPHLASLPSPSCRQRVKAQRGWVTHQRRLCSSSPFICSFHTLHPTLSNQTALLAPWSLLLPGWHQL